MKLSEKQGQFLMHVAQLVAWVNSHNGWYVTGGELFRTKEQQEIYFNSGKSKTMHSKHLSRLAIDLNLFINGNYRKDKDAYKPLADYWESLHPDNVAGFTWGWDANHFQRN